jgi:hypothetical protein
LGAHRPLNCNTESLSLHPTAVHVISVKRDCLAFPLSQHVLHSISCLLFLTPSFLHSFTFAHLPILNSPHEPFYLTRDSGGNTPHLAIACVARKGRIRSSPTCSDTVSRLDARHPRATSNDTGFFFSSQRCIVCMGHPGRGQEGQSRK